VKQLSLQDLNVLVTNLGNARDVWQEAAEPDRGAIKLSLSALQNEIELRRSQFWPRVFLWVSRHRLSLLLPTYLISALSLWLVVLWLRPIWLLHINEALKPSKDFRLPDWAGGITVSVRAFLLVNFFHYHPRVLDAWVTKHIEIARTKFQEKRTVMDRRVRVDVPVVLNGSTVDNLAATDLRRAFTRQRTRLLIWGEGGSGKTTLACHIATWAMADDLNERPCEHPMLPVLIEQDLPTQGGEQLDAVSVVSGRRPEVFDAVAALVREAGAHPNMRLLLVCRAFDLENDQRLRDLREQQKARATSISVGLLDPERVKEVVAHLGLSPDRLTTTQIELLRLPLHLALLAGVMREEPGRPVDFASAKDLYDAFWCRKCTDLRLVLGDPNAFGTLLYALCGAMN
jgi:hypothetical protein